MSEELKITCVDCPTERKATPAKGGGVKCPKGWKKIDDGFRCGKCQATKYVGRSIRLRLIGPAKTEERTRKDMYEALHAASRQSNQFANWMLQRLLAADVITTDVIRGLPKIESGPHAGKPKLPPAPEVDWYRDAVTLFPTVAPTSLVQQAQMVKGYYGKERFAAAVAMTKNVRSYRWDGLPVVVNRQSWKLVRIEETGRIALKAQIGPGKSWLLDVTADGENLLRMQQIADGIVIPGAAMFVRRARQKRPGESKPVRVWYLRISAQVPRAAKRRGKGLKEITLTLGHDRDSLLYGALDEGDDVFEYPAPILRSLIAAHKKLDRQLQIDASFRRSNWGKNKAKRWAARRTAGCEKNTNKVKNELALAAASLTKWCIAHDVTAVDYDVTPRDWMESFPYHTLAERIKCSLENAGVALHQFGESSTGNEIELTSEPVEAEMRV